MYGEHSDEAAILKVQIALDNARPEQAEIGVCKKNSSYLNFNNSLCFVTFNYPMHYSDAFIYII